MGYTEKFLKKYDWNLIQKYHDEGHSWLNIMKEFRITSGGLSFANKIGVFKSRNKSDSNKIAHLKFPKKHSEETKKKISESRIKYLKENPDKVPYLLNHSSKESYPEKYFTELFEKENIKVEKYLQIGLYELDFYIKDKKIDIEIDGEQHFTDQKIIESDIRRTKFLEENGWDVIRINWSHYKSIDIKDKINFIKELKMYIDKLIDKKPTIHFVDEKKCKCGNIKYKKAKVCSVCSKYSQRKVERPYYQQLLIDIENLGYSGTGRKYCVSDNTIRKWIKYYKKLKIQ